MAVQNEFSINPEPNRLPVAQILRVVQDESFSALALQVNIGGQDHIVLLSLGALQGHDTTNREVVTELQRIGREMRELGKIRQAVERLARNLR